MLRTRRRATKHIVCVISTQYARDDLDKEQHYDIHLLLLLTVATGYNKATATGCSRQEISFMRMKQQPLYNKRYSTKVFQFISILNLGSACLLMTQKR